MLLHCVLPCVRVSVCGRTRVPFVCASVSASVCASLCVLLCVLSSVCFRVYFRLCASVYARVCTCARVRVCASVCTRRRMSERVRMLCFLACVIVVVAKHLHFEKLPRSLANLSFNKVRFATVTAVSFLGSL